MRKGFSFYLILFLVLAVAGIAAANHGWSRRCQDEASPSSGCNKQGASGGCLVKCGDLPCPKMVLRAKTELELTDSQIAQLKALKLAAEKEKIRIKADTKILELELGELLGKKEVDKTAVDAKVDEIAKLSAQCTKRCIRAKLDTKALLTEDQLKKIETLDLGCAGANKDYAQKADADSPLAATAAEFKCPKSK